MLAKALFQLKVRKKFLHLRYLNIIGKIFGTSLFAASRTQLPPFPYYITCNHTRYYLNQMAQNKNFLTLEVIKQSVNWHIAFPNIAASYTQSIIAKFTHPFSIVSML